MKKFLPLTEEVTRDLLAIYDFAERYIGSKHNVVQPIWERIVKAVIEKDEPEDKA